MPEPIFTVADQLTMLRVALVPACVLLALGREFTWALVVFAVAGITDALDGYVARHSGQITRLGAMLDPLADKLLTGSAYVLLTWGGVATCVLPVWLTVTMLFRDAMLVVGVVVVNLSVGPIEFAPSRLGKASTAVNILTGAVVLAANAMGECPRALLWLYLLTVVMLIATTVHYIYLASERPRTAQGGPAQGGRGGAAQECPPD